MMIPVDKLIVSEYMYRHYGVTDKEMNFGAILYALESKLLPYNYFPEIQSVKAGTFGSKATIVKGEKGKDEKTEEVDIEKTLHELADV